MNRTIKIIRKTAYLWLLLSVLLTAVPVKAEIPDGHKPIPCIGCHLETLGADAGNEICGNCHYYGLDVSRLQAEHNPKICKACHVGNTVANGDEKEIFHNGHTAVKCTRCHTEDNFTVIKIKSNGFQCVSCHGTQVHSIHIKNIDKSCPICHGSWAAGKVYKGIEAPSLNKSEEKEKYEGFTVFNIISNIIRNLINSFLGI